MKFLRYLKDGFNKGIIKLQCIETYKIMKNTPTLVMILVGLLGIGYTTTTEQFGLVGVWLLILLLWVSNLGNV